MLEGGADPEGGSASLGLHGRGGPHLWSRGSACARLWHHGGDSGSSERENAAPLHPRCSDQPPDAEAQRSGAAGTARVSAATGAAGPPAPSSLPDQPDFGLRRLCWRRDLGRCGFLRFQFPRLQVKPARQVSPASSILGTLLPLCSAGVWALPAGTASDRFSRPPRGKCWPDVRGWLGVREHKCGLQEGALWAGACRRSQSEQVMRTKPYEDVGLWSQETVQSQPLGGTLTQLHLVC